MNQFRGSASNEEMPEAISGCENRVKTITYGEVHTNGNGHSNDAVDQMILTQLSCINNLMY